MTTTTLMSDLGFLQDASRSLPPPGKRVAGGGSGRGGARGGTKRRKGLGKLSKACEDMGVEWIGESTSLNTKAFNVSKLANPSLFSAGMPGMSRSAMNGSKVVGGVKSAEPRLVWTVDVSHVGRGGAKATLHGFSGQDTMASIVEKFRSDGMTHKQRAVSAGVEVKAFMPTCAPNPPKFREVELASTLEESVVRIKRIREYPEIWLVPADDKDALAEYLK